MATINSNSDSVYIDMSESLELYDKKIINGRKEQFLYALCALDSEGLPVPLSRIELWLNGLVTGDVPTIEPQSRNEYFLKAILTYDTTKKRMRTFSRILLHCYVSLFLRLNQSVGISLSLIHYIYLIGFCIIKYKEIMT